MSGITLPSNEVYQPHPHLTGRSHVRGQAAYDERFAMSLNRNDEFWARMAKEQLTWFEDFSIVRDGEFTDGTISWYLGGKLNASYNCLDRFVHTQPESLAIIWEGNDPKDVRHITYREALEETCRIANVLKQHGVKKGDKVCLYMPMVPEAAFAMLACARIGAPHIVVFAGFSSQSLAERINDTGCTVLFTADEGLRGTKVIPLKNVCDEAVKNCPTINTVFVHKRTGGKISWDNKRDVWLHEAMAQQRKYCPAEPMDSEDHLFYLHTSGSTGKPKGLIHTTGGYMTYASTTFKYIFDYQPGDVYCCVADIGWITGHTYIVYGPMSNGATTFMFEGVPTNPGPDRYWDMVARHKVNIFYTAPTALRALMRHGDAPVNKHDLSSLRVLGSVGEPINPEAWKWYYNVVGKGKCAIVDTYWQTETGGIILSSLPGSTVMKPGAGCCPFFGINYAILDNDGKELVGNDVTGVLAIKQPWPGMARSIYGDHGRYISAYLGVYKGVYFTGDRAIRDRDGHIWVTGRVDDVMNVSGHRLGSAELESALVEHKSISEAAVVSIPHEIKGEAPIAFVTATAGVESSPALLAELRGIVKKNIGSFAAPDMILVTNSLPKTRSGKIMRRLLRKIALLDTKKFGDTTTLADPSAVDRLVEQVKATKAKAKL